MNDLVDSLGRQIDFAYGVGSDMHQAHIERAHRAAQEAQRRTHAIHTEAGDDSADRCGDALAGGNDRARFLAWHFKQPSNNRASTHGGQVPSNGARHWPIKRPGEDPPARIAVASGARIHECDDL
jgi:hypothetical protein